MHKHKPSHFMTYLIPYTLSLKAKAEAKEGENKNNKMLREQKLLSDNEIWDNNYDRWLKKERSVLLFEHLFGVDMTETWEYIWPFFRFLFSVFQYWAHSAPKLFEYIFYLKIKRQNSFFYFFFFIWSSKTGNHMHWHRTQSIEQRYWIYGYRFYSILE